MTSNTLQKILELGPCRRFITRLSHNPHGRNLCQNLAGASGVFPSMGAAEAALQKYRPPTKEHLNQELISSNFQGSLHLRPSDYAVLFWLEKISAAEPLVLFDFGAGIGQTYQAMAPLLGPGRIRSWIVQDLPEVISRATDIAFPDGVPSEVELASELTAGSTCNTILAAGALHYWTDGMEGFFRQLGNKPRHFILNRSPMRLEGESYFTVQEGDTWAVPCFVRSFPDFVAEMKSEGYEMVDEWTVVEKQLVRGWRPDFSCPYKGAYFHMS